MIEIKGFDELRDQLNSLAKKLDGGEHQIPLTELFTEDFITRHTSFSSIDELLNASKFAIETEEDFAAIPDAEWDCYIRSVSSFDSWSSMLVTATEEWTIKRLGL